MKKDIKKVGVSIGKMIDAKQIYDGSIEGVKNSLKPFISFDFYIGFQPSDGFVIEHDMLVAPLGKCVNIILHKGKMSFDDYLSECI